MVLESLRKLLYSTFFTVLDRYFYSQLFVNYLIGVSFFASIIIINELYYIIRYYFEHNVPLLHVMSMMGALLPFLISFSVPFGVLPAYLLLLGRLSQDSEIVSMRACGISQFRIMLPGVVFGVMIMIFAYTFKNSIETKSNSYYLQLKAKVLAQKPAVQLMDNVFLNIGSVQISFESTSAVENGEEILHNVYAVDVENRRTIRAEEGRIYPSPDNPEHYTMKFINGDMNQVTIITNNDPNTSIANKNSAVEDFEETPVTTREEFYLTSFGTMTIHNYVWLPGDGFFRGPDTLTYEELKEQVFENPVNKETRETYYTLLSNQIWLDRLERIIKWNPQYFRDRAEDEIDLEGINKFIVEEKDAVDRLQAARLDQIKQQKEALPNYDQMKLYDKVALPVAALTFAVLCLPLGMFNARSGRGEGLSISLVVVLIFYGFKSAMENFISQNKFPPEFIWIPTAVFGVIAVILFARKVME